MTPRRSRREPDLRRRSKSSSEKPGNLVFIVCEGAKTEPTYFKYLKRRWRAHGITICGEECGSDPRSVVAFAVRAKKDRIRDAKRGGPLAYDQVWCVFDRDHHANIDQALDMAQAHDIRIALSTPCFEVWLILHFSYSTMPYNDCADVIGHLNGHLESPYDKSAMPMTELFPFLDTAVTNARRLRANNKATETDNPLTDVDKLIEEIRS